MKTRLYSPEDYATICEWWKGHKIGCVPAALLPKCGVLVEDEGELICAAWIYMDNSVGVAWMSWLTTKPKLTVKRCAKALEILMGAIEVLCNEFDYGILFTMTDQHGLGKWFERNGFSPNHSGMTQYFKPVKNHGT